MLQCAPPELLLPPLHLAPPLIIDTSITQPPWLSYLLLIPFASPLLFFLSQTLQKLKTKIGNYFTNIRYQRLKRLSRQLCGRLHTTKTLTRALPEAHWLLSLLPTPRKIRPPQTLPNLRIARQSRRTILAITKNLLHRTHHWLFIRGRALLRVDWIMCLDWLRNCATPRVPDFFWICATQLWIRTMWFYLARLYKATTPAFFLKRLTRLFFLTTPTTLATWLYRAPNLRPALRLLTTRISLRTVPALMAHNHESKTTAAATLRLPTNTPTANRYKVPRWHNDFYKHCSRRAKKRNYTHGPCEWRGGRIKEIRPGHPK